MLLEGIKSGLVLVTGGIVVVSTIAALAVRIEQKASHDAVTATQLSVAVQGYQIADLKEQLNRIENKLDALVLEKRQLPPKSAP